VTVLLAAMPAQAAALAPRSRLDGPVAGQYIYDTTGLLTATELRELEASAAQVRQAGAAIVVYLRAQHATYDQTEQDAADLMNRWDVETHPGARDGVVIYLNMQPGNLRHGQVALYAGQTLYNRKLPQAELQRIYSDVMLSLLRNELTASAIAAGLAAITHDLRYGPPPPSALQRVAVWLGRVPFNLLALIFIAWVLLLVRRIPARPAVLTTERLQADPPGDLPPALVGALVTGRIHDAQLEATILDFAHRGLLAIEPVGADKVHVRLLGTRADLSGLSRYEAAIWNALEGAADGDRIITSDQLARVHSLWAPAGSALRSELLQRGWFDPHAGNRRRPLYIAGTAGMTGAVIGIVIAILAAEGWAVFGVVGLLSLGIYACVRGYRIPTTSTEGERAALPWRTYLISLRAGLPLTATDAQLDIALPYAVAMGAAGAITSRHVAATGQGYSPSWFSSRHDEPDSVLHYYPYWVAFHSAMYPSNSSGGAGGFAGGGAAAGGGGAGGGF
jgi:uncharacterized membrane protein YgcG